MEKHKSLLAEWLAHQGIPDARTFERVMGNVPQERTMVNNLYYGHRQMGVLWIALIAERLARAGYGSHDELRLALLKIAETMMWRLRGSRQRNRFGTSHSLCFSLVKMATPCAFFGSGLLSLLDAICDVV